GHFAYLCTSQRQIVQAQDILRLYQEHPGVRTFSDRIHQSQSEKFRIKGLVASQPAFLISGIFRNLHRNTLVILNDREDALYFQNDLQAMMPRKEILWFPSTGKRPYQ